MDNEIYHVVIGTAGHIDHGKSSLVKSLTGIDPDRLKEEKERGLTIDLGFAPLILPDQRRVGIIDVPGHERFIKNMVAGATSIDFVMLVIAADDGIMPQTREHIEIMKILNIRKGMVVLTKVDKVPSDLLELAQEEIREFCKGTFLENAPMSLVSNVTGEGMEDLQKTLCACVSAIEPHTPEGVFRMPIQRVFSKHGHGTVVTGVPVSGRIGVGETIEILPGGEKGRVKKIQAYGLDVDFAQAGQSSAINLKDIDYKQTDRGNVAAMPGYFEPAVFWEGKFTYSSAMKRPLGYLTPVRFHTGTSETLGKLAILGKTELVPGEEAYVQIRLDEPVVAVSGDYFVLRLSSPTITIGGGMIIGTGNKKLKRFREKVIDRLQEKEQAICQLEDRVELGLKLAGFIPVKEESLLPVSNVPLEKLKEVLGSLVAEERIMLIKSHTPRYIHASNFEELKKRLIGCVENFFRKYPHRTYVDKLAIQNQLGVENNLWELLLSDSIAGQSLGMQGKSLFIPGRKVVFSEGETELLKAVEGCFLEQLFSPPKTDEVAGILKKSENAVLPLVEFLLENGAIVEVAREIVFHRLALEKAKGLILQVIKAKGELIAADFRDSLGTSRKYIIPLLEYFDQIGLTSRHGNIRVLKNG